MEPFFCDACSFDVPVVADIPLLVKDRVAVERMIEDARQFGLTAWYEDSHVNQWQGPYRHHLQKRKTYVENVLAEDAKRTGGSRVGLDLGCGDGMNLAWLSRQLPTLYACDYNLLRLTRAVRIAETAQLFMADVTDLPVADDAFDVIFFNHVLEHVPDDDVALSEARRILKPGGLLILGTPNEGALFWQLAYQWQPEILAASDHVHFYTAGSLRQKCQQAGFVIRKIDPIGWGVPNWELDSIIRRFKWVDDALEKVGRALLPSQATSLYAVLTKP
jgi:SAM-dependent methyltransferase